MTAKTTLGCLLATPLLLVSCSSFLKLGKDLDRLETHYTVSGRILNYHEQKAPVRALLVQWDQSNAVVLSADLETLGEGGAFAFMVEHPGQQFIAAHADLNQDGRYQQGEPFWMPRNTDGEPIPLEFDRQTRSVRVKANLSAGEIAPPALIEAFKRALEKRDLADFIRKQGIDFALGEVISLDDPRFTSSRGQEGLWTPASFATDGGLGVYFLEPYDPQKIPVLFIHGANGSPQDWRYTMEHLDRSHYQIWLFAYPSGLRLDDSATALNQAVLYLQQHHRFPRLDVLAHSMGGLVARRFIQMNLETSPDHRLGAWITYATPWGGHEAAALGVKWSPEVIPCWRDLANGSEFLGQLFDQRLKGKIRHHLFYSYHASRSLVLPAENDGTVSVASQIRPEAVEDAAAVRGFDETHISILSSPDVVQAMQHALDHHASSTATPTPTLDLKPTNP
jgi:pimeloyl-ACP methyl ester carboxylesterase